MKVICIYESVFVAESACSDLDSFVIRLLVLSAGPLLALRTMALRILHR